LLPLALMGVMGLYSMQLNAWPPETSKLIAGETVKYLPPALMALLKHFPDDFNAGFTAAQPAGTQAALDAQLLAAGETLEAQMHQTGDLPKFARQWGAYLRLVIEAADPLPGASVAEPARRDYADYFAKLTRRLKRVVIIEGTMVADDQEYLKEMQHRRSRYSREIHDAYLPDGSRRSALDFDDRSNVFGVSTLAYNYAVSDAVILLSRRWQRGGGDMTGSALARKPGQRAAMPKPVTPGREDATGFAP
jgi:hypothetical protein